MNQASSLKPLLQDFLKLKYLPNCGRRVDNGDVFFINHIKRCDGASTSPLSTYIGHRRASTHRTVIANTEVARQRLMQQLCRLNYSHGPEMVLSPCACFVSVDLVVAPNPLFDRFV